jgi:hypothetical protein
MERLAIVARLKEGAESEAAEPLAGGARRSIPKRAASSGTPSGTASPSCQSR